MSSIEEIIEQIYNEVKVMKDDGKVADYIPQLGKVNPELFAISVCKMDGNILISVILISNFVYNHVQNHYHIVLLIICMEEIIYISV